EPVMESVAFSAISTWKPSVIIGLIKDQIDPLIDTSIEITETEDAAILKVVPGLEIVVGLSPNFMDYVLNNDDIFSKPDASEVMEIFGAPGILSLSPVANKEPYQRSVVRDAINKFFTREMKSADYAISLQQNISDLLQT